MKFQEEDLRLLHEKEITPEEVNRQLDTFANGFPYLKVAAPATIGNGILVLSERQRHEAENVWNQFLKSGGKVVKMVPASGAASRMFKNLFQFAEGNSDSIDNNFMRDFFDGIKHFAFFKELNETCVRLYNLDIDSLIAAGRYRDIVKSLIYPEGLNYGALPKALLDFHLSGHNSRKAFEEHLAEGAQYAAGLDGKVHIHFTVSPDHIGLLRNEIDRTSTAMEREYGVHYDVSMSVQKPSTDTIAANPDNTPYRENGKLFFRPGGHGALIENLQEIDADVVFIKNIDNVVPDSKRASTLQYKRILGGILVETKHQIAYYVGLLRTGHPSRPTLNEMLDFLHSRLNTTNEKADKMDDNELANYILHKLNRPLRVCGMVRNEGEPGGGPFLTYNPDGTISPQILESTQFDPTNPESAIMMSRATHFNPVDLVCSTTDVEGHRFLLKDFVDPATGFISSKSRNGHDIKALELPGLWNGAMSNWNTIFVEVPADTFNPVKTVNDLLRPAHQQ